MYSRQTQRIKSGVLHITIHNSIFDRPNKRSVLHFVHYLLKTQEKKF